MEFELLCQTKRLLARRYSEEYRFHLVKPVNDILTKTRTPSHVRFLDERVYQQSRGRLRRFYAFDESIVRLSNYAKHYAKVPDYFNARTAALHPQTPILVKRARRLAKRVERQNEELLGEQSPAKPAQQFCLLRRLFAPRPRLREAHESDSLLVLANQGEIECRPGRPQASWENESGSVHDIYSQGSGALCAVETAPGFNLSISTRLSELEEAMASTIPKADSQTSSTERELRKISSEFFGSESLQVSEQPASCARRAAAAHPNFVTLNSLSCTNTRESCSGRERYKALISRKPQVEPLPLNSKLTKIPAMKAEKAPARFTALAKTSSKGFSVKLALNTYRPQPVQNRAGMPPLFSGCKTDRTLLSRPRPVTVLQLCSNVSTKITPNAILHMTERSKPPRPELRNAKPQTSIRTFSVMKAQRLNAAEPFVFKTQIARFTAKKFNAISSEKKDLFRESNTSKRLSEKSLTPATHSAGFKEYAPYNFPESEILRNKPKGKNMHLRKLNVKFL